MDLISKTVVRRILLGFFMGITVFIWYGVLAEERGGILTVVFLDVGQGDAIFIESPSGKQILIDAGANKKVLRELAKQMPFYDRSLDILIATHSDKDHIGGFPAVLDAYEVETFLETEVLCKNSICEKLDKQIQDKKIEKKIAGRGMVIDLNDGVFLEVLFPDRDATNLETNMASIILKLVYREDSFLLMGDSPKSIEEYLILLDSFNLDADVLKLGHHGSKTSSGESFIGYVSPEVAIVSAGKDNSYGHPHQEVLDVLEKFEVEVLRTDEDGTIVIKSDGESLLY